MTDKTYTHRDLAALLGVSETTVKSYRRKFPGCIPVASHGKPIRFTEEASKVAIRIRDLFETGMSVEDVRARLSKEFGWISADSPPEAAGPAQIPRRVSRVSSKGHEVGPELSIGVSNMAKSLVAMTQQQKSLAAKLDTIEKTLADLGRQEGGALAGLHGVNAASGGAGEEKIEQRLGLLEETLKALAGSIEGIARNLAVFMAAQSAALPSEAPEPGDIGAVKDAPPATPTPAWDEADDAPAPAAKGPHITKIIKIRPESTADKNVAAGNGQPDGTQTAAQETEPSRDFFALPMVVRTQQGRYVSAGGRGRGRFSIADLKALLEHKATATKRTSMRWEAHGKGWWLFLEQSDGGGTAKLLLMELPTQKSGNVAEILKLRSNDTDMHPAEFSLLLEKLAE